jgi:hypothetical protein
MSLTLAAPAARTLTEQIQCRPPAPSRHRQFFGAGMVIAETSTVTIEISKERKS